MSSHWSLDLNDTHKSPIIYTSRIIHTTQPQLPFLPCPYLVLTLPLSLMLPQGILTGLGNVRGMQLVQGLGLGLLQKLALQVVQGLVPYSVRVCVSTGEEGDESNPENFLSLP